MRVTDGSPRNEKLCARIYHTQNLMWCIHASKALETENLIDIFPSSKVDLCSTPSELRRAIAS